MTNNGKNKKNTVKILTTLKSTGLGGSIIEKYFQSGLLSSFSRVNRWTLYQI